MIDATVDVAPKIIEPTVFDLSSPGRLGVTFPEPDVPRAELPQVFAASGPASARAGRSGCRPSLHASQ